LWNGRQVRSDRACLTPFSSSHPAPFAEPRLFCTQRIAH
jgi:hypothetical protein